PLDELHDDPATARALATLLSARLVTLDEGMVEVAHEALLREWPRLEAWLADDRAGRVLQQRLAEPAPASGGAARPPPRRPPRSTGTPPARGRQPPGGALPWGRRAWRRPRRRGGPGARPGGWRSRWWPRSPACWWRSSPAGWPPRSGEAPATRRPSPRPSGS